MNPREKSALQSGEALKEKFAHHPEIKRIARHRQVPKHVFNARRELRTIHSKIKKKYVELLNDLSQVLRNNLQKLMEKNVLISNSSFSLQGSQRSKALEKGIRTLCARESATSYPRGRIILHFITF